jgi:hypothetical protein
MTTIIEVQPRGLKVRMNNQITLISKYKDDNGDYFYNENLQKQYFKDTIFETQPAETTQKDDQFKEYRFEVEYEHKGRANGFALTETKVRAKSYDEALQKVRKNFKNIFEISEA